MLQEQADGGFHLALRGRRCQMQHAHVVPIGVLRLVLAQRIVGLAEDKRREQVLAVTGVGKCARLAHQRPDDMAVVDSMRSRSL